MKKEEGKRIRQERKWKVTEAEVKEETKIESTRKRKGRKMVRQQGREGRRKKQRKRKKNERNKGRGGEEKINK